MNIFSRSIAVISLILVTSNLSGQEVQSRHAVPGQRYLKEYWGLGIGSAMVSTLIDFAKETGVIKLLTLEVHEQNTRAQKLYEKFGFEVVGSHKGKFFVNGNYYDDILMDLSL